MFEVPRVNIAVVALGALSVVGAAAVSALMPAIAGVMVLAGAVAVAAALLGQRSLPWLLVGVAVIPYFDYSAGFLVPPVVPRGLIVALVISVVLAPWAWSLLSHGPKHGRNVSELVLPSVLVVLGLISTRQLGAGDMLDIIPAAFFGGAFAYLCAQRFPDVRDWGGPATAGLIVLLLTGAEAYLKSPGSRLGGFSGYPILYAALLVALLPSALLWTYKRAAYLAPLLAAGAAAAVVASETRSAWIAVVLMALAALVVTARQRRLRVVGLIFVAMALAGTLIGWNDSLRGIVGERLSAPALTSEASTHRQSIYGFTADKLASSPLIGLGGPGAAKEELGGSTGIGASDNGYLALGSDLGLLGMAIGLIPAFMALLVLGRSAWGGDFEAERLAMALGLLGLAVVTVFFDIFYWPQSSLLAFGMAGVLAAGRATGPHRELA